MKRSQLMALLDDTPIVAAVKDDAGLEKCLTCDAQVVFVLYGDVISIVEQVARIKTAGKAAFVHLDLIDGLAAREVAVDYIAQNTLADGIISTKHPLVRYAKFKGLIAIQRFFLLDSLALVNVRRQLMQDSVDLIEILPGVMPKIIHKLVSGSSMPIIAGGLISDKEDVIGALGAGAAAISSTDPTVWFL